MIATCRAFCHTIAMNRINGIKARTTNTPGSAGAGNEHDLARHGSAESAESSGHCLLLECLLGRVEAERLWSISVRPYTISHRLS